jgi:hypothetical protein
MRNLRNDPWVVDHVPFILVIFVSLIALMASGCGPRPTESPLPTDIPTNPPPSPTPAPPPTQTLELINGDLVYTVVGIPPSGHLLILQDPSTGSDVAGQIPSAGKSIRTTGLEVNADGIDWLQVEYRGIGGWVDSAFLAQQIGDLPGDLASLAQAVTATLKAADYYQLTDFVHPGLCLRFSPYPSLRDSDLIFCPEVLGLQPASEALFSWGQYDGTGDPIQLTFLDYHQRFVYDQDFFQPDVVGFNQEVSSGNAINNISALYPDGMIIEYHFPGFDPQYGGMDWRSLRMVFVEDKGGWFLVALVHGEWTI